MTYLGATQRLLETERGARIMYQDGGTTVVRKRMGLLSVMVIGVTAIIVTSVISASGIVIYGLKVFDRKADNLGELVSEAARSLPELRESLPPALTDRLTHSGASPGSWSAAPPE